MDGSHDSGLVQPMTDFFDLKAASHHARVQQPMSALTSDSEQVRAKAIWQCSRGVDGEWVPHTIEEGRATQVFRDTSSGTLAVRTESESTNTASDVVARLRESSRQTSTTTLPSSALSRSRHPSGTRDTFVQSTRDLPTLQWPSRRHFSLSP